MPRPRSTAGRPPHRAGRAIVGGLMVLGAVGATSFRTIERRATPREQSGARRAPAGLVERALSTPGTAWKTRTTAHARIHVLVGSGVERRVPRLMEAVEDARQANLAWLGASAFAQRLELLFVGSRAQMRSIVGAPAGGHAEPGEASAIFVASVDASPPLRHELMHVLSWRLWGTPGGQWLSEGVATAAAGRCHGFDLHAMAARVAADGRYVPVDTLRRHFTVSGDTGLVHYVEAGSLVRYVDERYGRAGLRALWRTGLAGVQQSLGVDAAALEAGWRARVARTAPAPAGMYGVVRREGCEAG